MLFTYLSFHSSDILVLTVVVLIQPWQLRHVVVFLAQHVLLIVLAVQSIIHPMYQSHTEIIHVFRTTTPAHVLLELNTY